MLFIEWKPVIGWTIAVVLATLCPFAFWSMRKKRVWLRWTVRSFAVLFLIIDGLFVYAALVDSGTSYSTAVFSPDHRMAARVVYTDYGHERDADVEVFRRHGFSHETVYEARPLLTEKEIHWLDNKIFGWLVSIRSSASARILSRSIVERRTPQSLRRLQSSSAWSF